jgi:plastocyanin
MPSSGPGKVAFPVIIAIGGITGVLSYMIFSLVAPGPLFTPAEFFEPSPFSGPPSGEIKGEGGETGGATTVAGAGQQAGANTTQKNQTTVIPANSVIISILEGASVQGNPSFDPDTAEASINQTVAWKNEDSTAHTATSGKLFDSGIINPGDSYSIAAKKIGAGEHSYSCTIHPYMKGKIVIK